MVLKNKKTKYILVYNNNINNNINNNDIIVFDTSRNKILKLYNITRMLLRMKPVLDGFSRLIYDTAMLLLISGYNVILLGYSYGGAVISLVVENINANHRIYIKNLQIATFGSMYCIDNIGNSIKNVNYMHARA